MKNLRTLFLFSTLALFGISAGNIMGNAAFAMLQSDLASKKAPTRDFMIKTSKLIMLAKAEVASGKVYNGSLGLSVAHQRLALREFHAGQFVRAAYHSRLSRKYASEAISSNKKAVPAGFEVSTEEAGLFTVTSDLLSDQNLNTFVNKNNQVTVKKDEFVITETLADIAPERLQGSLK